MALPKRNITTALVVEGKSFDDPLVLVMIIVVVAVVGLLILMPLERVLGGRNA